MIAAPVPGAGTPGGHLELRRKSSPDPILATLTEGMQPECGLDDGLILFEGVAASDALLVNH